MVGDGSSRRFWRITDGQKNLCLAVAPPNRDATNMLEARAARAIGQHLLSCDIPVPAQYGWDEASGVLLFEDLGDCKLHDYVQHNVEGKRSEKEIVFQYKQILNALVKMQIDGAESFDVGWCCDTAKYNKQLMLERESGYFLHSFWGDVLEKKEPAGLREEFEDLANRAGKISSDYFLHRDFQSRNIMIQHDKPFFIDFQGGRLGPLAYDLASLLLDPYVNLSNSLQEELFDYYLDILQKELDIQQEEFRHEYLLLALHRNLQIVGAFSFLSGHRKKPFFRQFLHPAIGSLQGLMQKEFFTEYPVLRNCVKVSGQEFKK
jgi:aminoglycoside/choline kinase family phosphotransferase